MRQRHSLPGGIDMRQRGGGVPQVVRARGSGRCLTYFARVASGRVARHEARQDQNLGPVIETTGLAGRRPGGCSPCPRSGRSARWAQAQAASFQRRCQGSSGACVGVDGHAVRQVPGGDARYLDMWLPLLRDSIQIRSCATLPRPNPGRTSRTTRPRSS